MLFDRRILRNALILYLAVAACFYLVFGLKTIADWGWREIFADQWRLYKLYLELPFPSSILIPDNEHRAIFPGLVRVAEIRWLHGNQRLQLLLGAVLSVATFGLIGWRVVTDRKLSPFARTCGVALASVSIFWLANVRTLLHGNESVQAYLLTTFLCIGLLIAHIAVERSARGSMGVMPFIALASLCAFICTYSFGPGIAAFVSLAAVLFVSRVPLRNFAPLAGAMVLAIALYFLLPLGRVVGRNSVILPLLNLRYSAQWIASPAVYLMRPLVDIAAPIWPSIGPIDKVVSVFARAFSGRFGPVMTLVWPQALIGIAAFAALLAATFSVWRSRRIPGRAEALGLGIAWFGFTAALMIGLTRIAFFQRVPQDVYAYRYLVWPCLFWLGLGLIGLSRSGKFVPRVAKASVLAVSVLALATEFGWWHYSRLVKLQIDQMSAGLVVGVLDRHRPLGETVDREVLAALPLVREGKISMFAWPVAELIGKPLPEGTGLVTVSPLKLEINPVENLLPGNAFSVRVELTEATKPRAKYLLLLDASQRVVGLAVPGDTQNQSIYVGYIHGEVRQEELTVRVWS